MKKTILFLILSIIFIKCSKDDDSNISENNSPILSSENKIISFQIELNNSIYNGNINNNSKEIRFQTLGLENDISIIPIIEISEKATISPSKSTSQNFNNTINYLITAENGEVTNYKVITENTPLSAEKKILKFELNIDDESFEGDINNENLNINLETYKDISNVIPIIEVSENSTISPDLNEPQNFNNPVEYIVTAQNGTSNTYTINVSRPEINSTIEKSYVRAISFGRVTNIDLEQQTYELYLENNTNSYLLSFFDIHSWESNGIFTTNFYFQINEDINTANDYKLKFKLNGQTKAETSYYLDILKENAPKINSSNQQIYSYDDNLILTGENLVAGIRIPANGIIYQFGNNNDDVSINPEKTTLTLKLDYDRAMFPSWLGQDSPKATRVSIYYNGRYGDSIILDFD